MTRGSLLVELTLAIFQHEDIYELERIETFALLLNLCYRSGVIEQAARVSVVNLLVALQMDVRLDYCRWSLIVELTQAFQCQKAPGAVAQRLYPIRHA